ncbi:hypothetical protein AMTR_s00092p00171950 [Amborella trichopoda]|uniref:Uncharacterized protein n=1 Tax=Amborella trichopoda TaxID=13333 RepID=W1NQT2_AMBTC|nr:hypothetical protein AMTR_s00092p00171950 [Amborella trichopoda]
MLKKLEYTLVDPCSNEEKAQCTEVHYNLNLSKRQLRRKVSAYNPINLHYNFNEDPSDEWLVEQEEPTINKRLFGEEVANEPNDQEEEGNN